MLMTFKDMLWIQVIKKWIYYQLVKNHFSTVLKIESKMEYAVALTNWAMSDFMMNLVILGYALKDLAIIKIDEEDE